MKKFLLRADIFLPERQAMLKAQSDVAAARAAPWKKNAAIL
jgi:hypothetical protein